MARPASYVTKKEFNAFCKETSRSIKNIGELVKKAIKSNLKVKPLKKLGKKNK